LHLAIHAQQEPGDRERVWPTPVSAPSVQLAHSAHWRGKHRPMSALLVRLELGVHSVAPAPAACVQHAPQAGGVTGQVWQTLISAPSANQESIQRWPEQFLARLAPNAQLALGVQILLHHPSRSACNVHQAPTMSKRDHPQ